MSKWLSVTFHLVASMLLSPILYLIIVYEKNRNYRTLINQMVSSIMWNALVYNLVVPPLTLLIYIVSPTNSPIFCRVYLIIHNIIINHVLLLLDSLIVIKYFFIFHLKNPTAIQDDFWKMWIFSLFLISQIVIHSLPGRESTKITICTGKIPAEYVDSPIKLNYLGVFVAVFTIFVHSAFFTFQMVLNHTSLLKMSAYKNYKIKWSKNTDDMFSLVSMFAALITVLLSHLLAVILVSMPPSQLDSYPYYILAYSLDNLNGPFTISLFLITYLIKHDIVRREVCKELQNFVNDYVRNTHSSRE